MLTWPKNLSGNRTELRLFICWILAIFFFGGCGEDHASITPPPVQTRQTPVSHQSIADISVQDTSSSIYLNTEEKKFLLTLARRTLELYLEKKTLPEIDWEKVSPLLREKRGCFVTLEKQHRLRGCIGHLQPREPLIKAVLQNAVNAAVRDHRFPPVTREELDDLSIEISMLTVPKLLEHNGPEDLLAKLVPERDGVILKNSYHQSTYLPQVWKQLPQKEEFLSRLCLKGGGRADCWKDPKTEIYIYRAQVFSEEELQNPPTL